MATQTIRRRGLVLCEHWPSALCNTIRRAWTDSLIPTLPYRDDQRGDSSMKIRVTLKDPDTMHDSVDDAFMRLPRPNGISKSEWAVLCEARASDAKSEIARRWMAYGEYLEVEFDLEAGTATVLPAK